MLPLEMSEILLTVLRSLFDVKVHDKEFKTFHMKSIDNLKIGRFI